MGGLFSSPPPPPPLSPPLPIDDGETEKRRLRIEALKRRRRGRTGTIATSPKGFLSPGGGLPKRKSLLGE